MATDFNFKTCALPVDQNKRSAALKLMIDSIKIKGFGSKEYDSTFWTNIKTNYDALLAQASGTYSTVATTVSNKNILKAELKKTLNAVINS